MGEKNKKPTFSEAVQAIVESHAMLYVQLLEVLPAYRGEAELPPRGKRVSRILDCETNNAHLLLENLATAAKAVPRGSLGAEPDILIAECRSFLEFLEDNLPCPECAAAINDACQIEEAFVNFIKGISGGDPGMTRRQYAKRIDKFLRDMKASFRTLGHSIVKLECTLGRFRISQKPEQPPDGFTQHDRKVLHQIQQVAVYGNNPTDSQMAGNIRHEQVIYGANRYKPSSGKSRGYSAYRAATDAIKATEFKNKPGAYTIAEKSSLAQAIRREYNKGKADSATSHTKM